MTAPLWQLLVFVKSIASAEESAISVSSSTLHRTFYTVCPVLGIICGQLLHPICIVHIPVFLYVKIMQFLQVKYMHCVSIVFPLCQSALFALCSVEINCPLRLSQNFQDFLGKKTEFLHGDLDQGPRCFSEVHDTFRLAQVGHHSGNAPS